MTAILQQIHIQTQHSYFVLNSDLFMHFKGDKPKIVKKVCRSKSVSTDCSLVNVLIS